MSTILDFNSLEKKVIHLEEELGELQGGNSDSSNFFPDGIKVYDEVVIDSNSYVSKDYGSFAPSITLHPASTNIQNLGKGGLHLFGGDSTIQNVYQNHGIITSAGELILNGDIQFNNNIVSASGTLYINANSGSYIKNGTIIANNYLQCYNLDCYGGVVIASGEINGLDNDSFNIVNNETLVIQKGKFDEFPLTITWPYNTEYKGTINATESFNLKDKDGGYIIQDGKLNGSNADLDSILNRLNQLEKIVADLSGDYSQYDVMGVNFIYTGTRIGPSWNGIRFKVNETLLEFSNTLTAISLRHFKDDSITNSLDVPIQLLVFKNGKFAATTDYYSGTAYMWSIEYLKLSDDIKLEIDDVITILLTKSYSSNYEYDDVYYSGVGLKKSVLDELKKCTLDSQYIKDNFFFNEHYIYTGDHNFNGSYKSYDVSSRDIEFDYINTLSSYNSSGYNDVLDWAKSDFVGDINLVPRLELIMVDFNNRVSTVRLSNSNKAVLKSLLESAVEVTNEEKSSS